MFRKLTRFFGGRSGNVIGIDIGTSAVKIAEVDMKKSQPVLKCIGLVDLPAGLMANGYCHDARTLADILRRLISTSGARARDAALAIGSPGLFVREANFPLLSAEELKEAVKWDSEKYIPYAPGSYYLDYAVAGKGASDLETRVLLVAAPQDTVDSLVTAVKLAGLTPVAIDAEPLAIHRTIMAADNAMVVDIGAEISQVTLFQSGSPVATRPIPIGGRRFTETVMDVLELEFEEAERLKQRQRGLLQRFETQEERTALHNRLEMLVAELAREALRTAEYYKIQNKSAEIDKVFITGGGAKLDNLAQYFAAQFDMPVVSHDPLGAVTIGSGFDPQYVREMSPGLGVAIGLALRGGES